MSSWERHCHEPNALIGHVGFLRGLCRSDLALLPTNFTTRQTAHKLRLTAALGEK